MIRNRNIELITTIHAPVYVSNVFAFRTFHVRHIQSYVNLLIVNRIWTLFWLIRLNSSSFTRNKIISHKFQQYLEMYDPSDSNDLAPYNPILVASMVQAMQISNDQAKMKVLVFLLTKLFHELTSRGQYPDLWSHVLCCWDSLNYHPSLGVTAYRIVH